MYLVQECATDVNRIFAISAAPQKLLSAWNVIQAQLLAHRKNVFHAQNFAQFAQSIRQLLQYLAGSVKMDTHSRTQFVILVHLDASNALFSTVILVFLAIQELFSIHLANVKNVKKDARNAALILEFAKDFHQA